MILKQLHLKAFKGLKQLNQLDFGIQQVFITICDKIICSNIILIHTVLVLLSIKPKWLHTSLDTLGSTLFKITPDLTDVNTCNL